MWAQVACWCNKSACHFLGHQIAPEGKPSTSRCRMAAFAPRVGLTVLFAFAFLGPSAGQENGLPNGTCFEDAVAAELRKNLTNMEGESVPVTFLLAGWSSAHLTSSVIEILISEIMGYVIAIEPRAPPSSLDSIYCMLGCETWWNTSSRGCETRKVKHHMMIDSWYLSYTHAINSLAEIYGASWLSQHATLKLWRKQRWHRQKDRPSNWSEENFFKLRLNMLKSHQGRDARQRRRDACACDLRPAPLVCPWCQQNQIPHWQHLAWSCPYFAAGRPQPLDWFQARFGWPTADYDTSAAVLRHLEWVRRTVRQPSDYSEGS